eukprot:4427932-Alexandrium_andersonii.AAC.1
MDPATVAERKRKAVVHLEFMVEVYRSQLGRGARFLHGHPMTTGSWDEDCVKRLMERPEVQRGAGHMCRFGMAAPKPACAGGSGTS